MTDRPTPEMDALFARHTGEMEKLIPALFRGEITPAQYYEHTIRQAAELMAHAREMERKRDLAREFQAAIDTEIVMSLELAEGQVASERLGGNAVKESFWLGELAALRRMQNVIHASATTTVEAATATKPAAQAAVLCQQCAIEQRRLADWDAHHYGTRGPCEACGREVLCAMVPPQPEAAP